MLRVVLDTNIIISAILFGGKPEKLIKLALAGKINLLISYDIIAETVFILRNKFKWSNYQVREVDLMLRDTAILVAPLKRLSVVDEDDADNRILECALEGKADYIISGDKKHLLRLESFKGIPIISADIFLKRFTQ